MISLTMVSLCYFSFLWLIFRNFSALHQTQTLVEALHVYEMSCGGSLDREEGLLLSDSIQLRRVSQKGQCQAHEHQPQCEKICYQYSLTTLLNQKTQCFGATRTMKTEGNHRSFAQDLLDHSSYLFSCVIHPYVLANVSLDVRVIHKRV